MRNFWLVMSLCVFAVSCSSDEHAIGEGDLPSGVRSAFIAEHPYATIDHPTVKSNPNGEQETYEIPYTRPDGTSGKAEYNPAGAVLNDK